MHFGITYHLLVFKIYVEVKVQFYPYMFISSYSREYGYMYNFWESPVLSRVWAMGGGGHLF